VSISIASLSAGAKIRCLPPSKPLSPCLFFLLASLCGHLRWYFIFWVIEEIEAVGSFRPCEGVGPFSCAHDMFPKRRGELTKELLVAL